ncbi:MAG: WD40/YVTN/BNR-like repeat-containing protein, partial [Candidatus Kapaibacterium sp.]
MTRIIIMSKITSLFAAALLLLVANACRGQNFWEPCQGPYGADVASIAISPNGSIFVSAYGRIYRTTNNGQYWEPNIIDSGSYFNLAIDSNGTIYAGDNGLLTSTDNGDTWLPALGRLHNSPVTAIAVSPNGYLLAGTYVYVNNGRTADFVFEIDRCRVGDTLWTQCDTRFGGEFKSFAFSSTGYDFANINGSLLRSSMGDSDWKLIYSGTDTGGSCSAIESLAIRPDGSLFAGIGCGAIRSIDNGISWIPIDSGLPIGGYPFVTSFALNDSGILFAGISNNSSVSEEGIYRSSNNGDAWVEVDSGLKSNPRISALAITHKSVLFAGSNTNLYNSTDNGFSWEEADTGMMGTWVSSVYGLPNGVVIASLYQCYLTDDNGLSWNLTSDAEGYFAVDSLGRLYTIGSYSTIMRSTDTGRSWTSLSSSSGKGGILAFDNKNDVFSAVPFGGLFRSTDDGRDWDEIDSSLQHESIQDVSLAPNGHVFVGTYGDGIFRSTNYGNSWSRLTNSPLDNSVLISPSGKIFAWGTQGLGLSRVSSSSNDGDDWNFADNGLPESDFPSLAFDKEGLLFASEGYQGVYSSSNDGETWSNAGNGLPNFEVNSIAVTPEGILFAGLEGAGVYRSIRSVSGIREIKEDGYSFVLTQNSPNPFPQSTAISFT